MQLLLIRHGESQNNHNFATTGSSEGRVPDPRLTQRGREQAAALAQRITDASYPPITHLYCSLMLRAVETATPVAAALDLPLQGHPAIFEVAGPFSGTGASARWYPGAPRQELAAVTPRLRLPEAATESGWWGGPLEDRDGAARRGREVLASLRASHDAGDCVALVSHVDFCSVLVNAVLGTAASNRLCNTGTHLLRLPASGSAGSLPVRVEWLNRFDHLGPSHVTG